MAREGRGPCCPRPDSRGLQQTGCPKFAPDQAALNGEGQRERPPLALHGVGGAAVRQRPRSQAGAQVSGRRVGRPLAQAPGQLRDERLVLACHGNTHILEIPVLRFCRGDAHGPLHIVFPTQSA